MGWDSIQLETAVSTISQEYLLEFTSEYDISEDLHPEVTAPGDRIVDFPEDKIGVYTKFFEFANFHSLKNWNNRFFWVDERVFPTVVDWRESAPKDEKPAEGSYSVEDVARLDTQMNLFNLISALNPAKIRTGTRPRATHEVPLLTVTANRVIDMEEPATATESSGTPSTIERSPLDFANENPSHQINEGDRTKDQVLETGASEVPPTGHASTMGVTPNIVIEVPSEKNPLLQWDWRRAPPCLRLPRRGLLLVLLIRTRYLSRSHSQPWYEILLSLLRERPSRGIQILRSLSPLHPLLSTSHCWVAKADYIREMGRITQQLPRFEHHRDASACQDAVDHMVPPGYFLELRHLPNEEFLNQYNVNLARQVAMGSQLRLRFEQEVRLLKKAKEKVAKRDQRIHAREEEIKKLDQEVQGLRNQTRNLETLLEAEVDMKKAAEANSAELTRELESLRAKFADLQVNNNQLFQQVSTLQAQVTGEEQIKAAFEEFKKREDDKVGRRCAEMNARLDALSIDFDEELIAKGVSEGLKHGVEHGKAQLDLEVIEAYDTEADAKYVAALHALKDLKYPLIDHLEKLKDTPIDLIMASLHLEKVRDPRDPWTFKEEMLLEDAIMANVSRAEKKKKCRVVCRTHRIRSAHHPRSDGISVLVPTVDPQGLAILLTDVATRIEITEDEASPRLIRSKSLVPMYNLDWP
ncbi:hypothetical protein Tco_0482353 [Tanacetum coccineum]